MIAILLLFLVGVVLLASDIFVASFLLAVFGCVVMLVGCAVAYRDFGAWGVLIAAPVALALLGGTIYVELVLLPKTLFGRGLVVRSTSGAAQQPVAVSADVVGKAAVALTTLAPSGYVLVDGRRYEAFCQSGLAAKDSPLRVTGLDNFRLIVSRL